MKRTKKSPDVKRQRRAFTAKFYEKNHLRMAATSLLMVLIGCLYVSRAYVLQQFIDAVSDTGYGRLINALWLALGYFIMNFVIEITRREVKPHAIERAVRQYKEYVFERITKKNLRTFAGETTSLYVSALTNDATSIQENYINGFMELTVQVTFFIAALAMMFWYNWSLTLVVLGISLIPTVVSLILSGKLAKADRKVSDRNAFFVGTIKDLLSGFSVIKSFKAETQAMKLFNADNAELESIKCYRRRTERLIHLISSLASFITLVTVVAYGVVLAIQGEITAGVIIAFMNLMGHILYPIEVIPDLFAGIKASTALIDKLAVALDVNVQDDGTQHPAGIGEGIRFQNVSFAYEPDAPVLRDIDLNFEHGKSYAIVGSTGSGKSTLLNLMLGGYTDYEGKVWFDDSELRDIASESLYDLVSVIQQNIFIFDSTIENNITMFRKFDAALVQSAIEKAGLSDFIAERGPDYLCGENGSGLSGGEKQRISIARCLLRSTPVLLVDEATASLDKLTAYHVINAMLDISQTMKIIVTHRLDEDLLRRYDQIIALRGGALTEKGTFDELMAAKGYFYSLYNVAANA